VLSLFLTAVLIWVVLSNTNSPPISVIKVVELFSWYFLT
jgi:hypothetical protein